MFTVFRGKVYRNPVKSVVQQVVYQGLQAYAELCAGRRGVGEVGMEVQEVTGLTLRDVAHVWSTDTIMCEDTCDKSTTY